MKFHPDDIQKEAEFVSYTPTVFTAQAVQSVSSREDSRCNGLKSDPVNWRHTIECVCGSHGYNGSETQKDDV